MILPSQLISKHIFNQHLAGQLRALKFFGRFISLMRSEVPFMIDESCGFPNMIGEKTIM